jgi:hypothetical protein
MAKKKHPPVSEEEARRGIYIDFEGTMKDEASLLGVLVCDDAGREKYYQAVFEKALWPAVRQAKPGQRHGYNPQRAEFPDTLYEVQRRAKEEDRRVFAYSNRELDEIRQRLPLRMNVEWWEGHLINVLPYARRWKRRHHPDVEFPPGPPGRSARHTLANYQKLIGYDVPQTLGSGHSAKRLREVREMLNRRDGKFSQLTNTKKAFWTKALRHNWHDCRGTRCLMIRCIQDIP